MEAILYKPKRESSKPPSLSDAEYRKKVIFWDGVSMALKTTGIIAWMIILLFTMLEIKRYTNIDLIPGYDSAVDDFYGSVRGSVTNAIDDLE